MSYIYIVIVIVLLTYRYPVFHNHCFKLYSTTIIIMMCLVFVGLVDSDLVQL